MASKLRWPRFAQAQATEYKKASNSASPFTGGRVTAVEAARRKMCVKIADC